MFPRPRCNGLSIVLCLCCSQNPQIRARLCTSHELLAECAADTRGARGLPRHFHTVFLDFCGVWGTGQFKAGKKKRRDVEMLFGHRMLDPRGSVLGLTSSRRGLLLTYEGEHVDNTLFAVQDMAQVVCCGP